MKLENGTMWQPTKTALGKKMSERNLYDGTLF